MLAEKDKVFNLNSDIDMVSYGEGTSRKIMGYSDDMMMVENIYKKGAVGAIHAHPHTQMTYIVSGVFEFTVGDETRTVKAGDTFLAKGDVKHGCTCLEEGIFLDVFTPMREDFVK